FAEDGRGGALVISNDRFPVCLFDLPAVVESFKTYDDSALVKIADIGQMIMVGESDIVADVMEYRHWSYPPLRDARK
ncbi:LOW QUALITY PROTEIN: TAFII55_N domain-containing protein, partial [Cephalotus follicularis]